MCSLGFCLSELLFFFGFFVNYFFNFHVTPSLILIFFYIFFIFYIFIFVFMIPSVSMGRVWCHRLNVLTHTPETLRYFFMLCVRSRKNVNVIVRR